MSPLAAGSLAAMVAGLFVGATALAAGLFVRLLHPLLVRYALARPNARSAHVTPTPQGGGIAVLLATGAGAIVGAAVLARIGDQAGFPFDQGVAWVRLLGVLLAAALVAIVGLVDDLRPLPPLPRLALQLIAVAVAVSALPPDARVLPMVPLAAERVLLVFGGAWFVNLTNFMDGMDWLTVVETVPITAALSVFWACGLLSAPAGVAMLALCGGLLGFAPSNRPVAQLFLGDVGSLPIGLLVAFGLYDLAAHGGLAAAILLPLYSIADSGLTLAWRLRRGERVWEAHRHHFYQVAVARGMSVPEVLARVLVTNVALAGFAGASLAQPSPWLGAGDLVMGAGIVAVLLRALKRGRPAQPGAE